MTATSRDGEHGADARFALLGDQPYFEGADPLGYDQLAADLIALILGSSGRTPFTLGIEAPWGAGKSSLMRRLEASLKKTADVETVWFDAWAAERGDVLEGLIKSVLEKLDGNVLRKAARNKNLLTGARIFVTMIAGLFRVGSIVNELWERASIDPKARNELRDVLEDAMQAWIKKGTTDTHGRLLVVFVDNLDRCSPDAVFQAFEAIKLYLDAKGFVFVVGFDKTIVSEAVLEQKRYSKTVTGSDYIEKIVQIQYRLPEPTPDQLRALMTAYTNDSRTARLLDDEDARTLIVSENARNPRRVKRFLNTFVLEHKLDADAATIPPATLIRTLILEMYFWDFIRLAQEGGDPIKEFVNYLDVREKLRRRDPVDPPLEKFMRDHDVVPGPDAKLADLEENLPEGFPELARNKSFVKLVRDLDKAPDREHVRSKLEQAGAKVERGASAAELGLAREERTLELPGLRILWVDDEPEGNAFFVSALKAAGASVVQVESQAAAEALLDSSAALFDVLISDIGRGNDLEAGFDGARALKKSGLLPAKVVFFTSRVTPSRRKRAMEFGASITSDDGELTAELQAFADARSTAKTSIPLA